MASRWRFDGKDHTKEFARDDIIANKTASMCAATGILFFAPFISDPESEYGKFWANQGLITLILEVLCLICGLIVKFICWVLGLIPVIGVVFSWLYTAVFIILWAIAILYIFFGIYYVAKNMAKNLPFIGFLRFIK